MKAIRHALNIVASAQFGGSTIEDAEARLDRHLGDVESAAKVAVGAIDVCGLLLEYIAQIQDQFRDMVRPLLDHMNPDRTVRPEDGFAKTPQQILKFISDRLPNVE